MTTPRSLSMGQFEWMLLIVLSMLWGGAFFFGRIAVAQIPPFSLVLSRVLLAAVILHLVLRASGRRLPVDAPTLRAFLVMGLVNNLMPFSLIFWGQIHIGSGLASILNATTPLMTCLLAHWLTTDERLSRGRLAGVLVGITGVAVMIGAGLLAQVGTHVLAELAILGAALCYATSGIYARRLKRHPPLVIATGQLTASSLLTLPLVLWIDRPWTLPLPDPGIIAAVLFLALFSTALAYLLYFRILSTAGASNAALVTFLVPVSALMLGALFLGERLAPHQVAGMVLIATGLVLIDGRAVRALARLRHGRRRDTGPA